MKIKRSFFSSFLALSLSLSVVPLAQAANRPDAWITTKAKLALFTSSDIDSGDVHLDTNNGVITLYGKVKNAAMKNKAETVAKGIEGTHAVRNLLQVVPPAKEDAVAESDKTIADRVKKTINDDPALKDTGVDVKSVDNGVVLLAGKARDVNEYLHAVECARHVSGVKRVASEVNVESGVARNDDNEKTTPTGDAWLTMQAKMKLVADKDVPATEVSVDTYNGTVTLFGIVSSNDAKAAAEKDVKGINGVKKVDNNLQVVPEAKKEVVARKDDQVKREVKNALDELKDLGHVNVDVKNGVVRLTGEVKNEWQRYNAAIAARSQKGVRAVEDALHVKN